MGIWKVFIFARIIRIFREANVPRVSAHHSLKCAKKLGFGGVSIEAGLNG